MIKSHLLSIEMISNELIQYDEFFYNCAGCVNTWMVLIWLKFDCISEKGDSTRITFCIRSA